MWCDRSPRAAREQGGGRARTSDGDFLARVLKAPVHQAIAVWWGLPQPKWVQRIEVTP